MGYDTRYSITWDKTKHPAVDPFVQQWLEDIDQADYFDEDYVTEEAMKWYECEEDMLALSNLCPNVVFTLRGYGENTEDIWELHVLNGQSERLFAEIVFAPTSLKEPT
jgi:hypothetical protein